MPHSEADLTNLALEAFEASGLTQQAAADQLGVSQPAIAQAINKPERNLTKLRIEIIEAFTCYRVKGPEYRLVEED